MRGVLTTHNQIEMLNELLIYLYRG
jgi:hypothetical protein